MAQLGDHCRLQHNRVGRASAVLLVPRAIPECPHALVAIALVLGVRQAGREIGDRLCQVFGDSAGGQIATTQNGGKVFHQGQ